MARKKGKTNKTLKKKAKDKQTQAKTTPPSLEDIINKADSALVITATQGNIEVLGIKNTNYAYQAKGLMLGALDSYLVRPISSALRDMSNLNMRINHNTLTTIRKLLGDTDETKEK